MAPYDARAVANFLLDHAEEHGVELTQVSLLKLLYFSHGWFLSVYDRSLISNDFEAWKYGPVVKVVRDAFKAFRGNPIKSRAEKFDVFSGNRALVRPDLEPSDREFIIRVFQSYQNFDAWQLSEMTHEAGSPWDRIWNATSPVGRIGLRIRNDEIKAHFDRLSRRSSVS